MENLIDDLLDQAKLENKSFKLNEEFFNLSNTVIEAFQIMQHSASEKGIELEAIVDC